jgi:hypothetical protein
VSSGPAILAAALLFLFLFPASARWAGATSDDLASLARCALREGAFPDALRVAAEADRRERSIPSRRLLAETLLAGARNEEASAASCGLALPGSGESIDFALCARSLGRAGFPAEAGAVAVSLAGRGEEGAALEGVTLLRELGAREGAFGSAIEAARRFPASCALAVAEAAAASEGGREGEALRALDRLVPLCPPAFWVTDPHLAGRSADPGWRERLPRRAALRLASSLEDGPRDRLLAALATDPRQEEAADFATFALVSPQGTATARAVDLLVRLGPAAAPAIDILLENGPRRLVRSLLRRIREKGDPTLAPAVRCRLERPGEDPDTRDLEIVTLAALAERSGDPSGALAWLAGIESESDLHRAARIDEARILENLGRFPEALGSLLRIEATSPGALAEPELTERILELRQKLR